jgi:hypothetical protein
VGPSFGLDVLKNRTTIIKILQDLFRINLPEVVEAIQEGSFVVQKYGAVICFRDMNWWPGTHVTKFLVRQGKSMV